MGHCDRDECAEEQDELRAEIERLRDLVAKREDLCGQLNFRCHIFESRFELMENLDPELAERAVQKFPLPIDLLNQINANEAGS
jgi:hypothetical protein